MDTKTKLTYCSFNQELTCIAIGLENKFLVYDCGDFHLLYSYGSYYFNLDVGVSIVEMVYSSNLIVVVGLIEDELFSPKKATIWATNTSTCLCKLPFISKIEAIKLNRSR